MRTFAYFFIGIVVAAGILFAGYKYSALNISTNADSLFGAATSTPEATHLALTASEAQPLLPPRPVPDRCGQSTPGVQCAEYRNEKYRFSIFYPESRSIKEYDEGGGAMTITFENFDAAHGFQTFIVPYSGDKVSPERFKMDVPSGVRTNERTVIVDGVPGAAFYSNDMRLGDTYEIWFIHGGYLYEITTLKSREENLNERMQTWRFL